MPFFDVAMQDAAAALTAKYKYAQSHFGDPGSAGTANPNTGPRILIPWAAATGTGNFNLTSSIDFTGIAANNAVTWVSVWSAISGGTCGGKFLLAGDLVANASGEYSVTTLPLNGVAT